MDSLKSVQTLKFGPLKLIHFERKWALNGQISQNGNFEQLGIFWEKF